MNVSRLITDPDRTDLDNPNGEVLDTGEWIYQRATSWAFLMNSPFRFMSFFRMTTSISMLPNSIPAVSILAISRRAMVLASFIVLLTRSTCTPWSKFTGSRPAKHKPLSLLIASAAQPQHLLYVHLLG